MNLVPAKHRDAHRFPDADAGLAHTYARYMAAAEKERPGAWRDLGTWETELRRVRSDMDEKARLFEEQRVREQPTRHHRKVIRAEVARIGLELDAAEAVITQQLRAIAALSPDKQRAELDALYKNIVQHRAALHGEVSGKELSAPDWKAARGLLTASSEPSVLRLEEAFERGRFGAVPESDFPMADISGRLGNQEVTAHAELTPLPTEAGPGARALMDELAERMRDPLEALGPKTQQAMQYLLATWLARRNADGWLVIHIAQIAEALGYSQRATGDYKAEAYTAIRGFIDQLQRCQLRVRKMPELRGKASRSNFEEPAFTFGFLAADEDIPHIKGRPSQHWVSLRFRPNSYLSAVADREGAFLMGADLAINRLDTQHQRTTVLLGKYLERHLRFNWNKQPGMIVRSVRQLLTEGMGLSVERTERPSAETMYKLVNDLDELEGLGTLSHWEGDADWDAVRDALDGPGKRMTPRLWGMALNGRITINAGAKYHEQYQHHGLSHQPNIDPLILELRGYLSRNQRSQKLIAADLGISQAQLSLVISGKRKPTDELRHKLDALLLSERTLPLSFD